MKQYPKFTNKILHKKVIDGGYLGISDRAEPDDKKKYEAIGVI